MPETVLYQTPSPPKKRQSPFQRRADGKPLIRITARQHEILVWLSQLKYLDTNQIARFFYKAGSRKLAERELRRLYDGGHVNRFPIPLTRKWGTSPLRYGATRTLHCLDSKGRAYVKKFDTQFISKLNYFPQSILQLGNIEHQLALNDYLLATYKAAMN